jgi:hypothetical protein
MRERETRLIPKGVTRMPRIFPLCTELNSFAFVASAAVYVP